MKSPGPPYIPEVLPDALAEPLRGRARTLLGDGALAMGRRPGRTGDLAGDLATVRRLGIGTALALVPEEPDDARAFAVAGIEVLRFPVVDFGVPQDGRGFRKTLTEVTGRIRKGGRVLVFCGMGLGRTGMTAS